MNDPIIKFIKNVYSSDRVLRERRARASTSNPAVPSYCLERVATEVNTDNIRAPDSYSEASPILSLNSVNR